MSLDKDKKYSLGTPSLMRGLEKGQECEVKFLTDPKPVETEHGSKFDIQILLLSHPHPNYSSLDKKGEQMVWRTNCHVVRKTIIDLFKDNAEEFIEDWYKLTWTISYREDGNIWVEA